MTTNQKSAVAVGMGVATLMALVVVFGNNANLQAGTLGAAARDAKVADAVNSSSAEKAKVAPQIIAPLCNTSTKPGINILSPNGGEVFTPGQQVHVRFQTCNLNNKEGQIGFIDDRIQNYVHYVAGYSTITSFATLVSSVGNVKVYDYLWTVPAMNIAFPPYQGIFGGAHYKFIAFTQSNPFGTGGAPNTLLMDTSDYVFTINYPIAGCNSSLGYSSTSGLPCWFETKAATSITSNSADLNGFLYDVVQPVSTNCCTIGFNVVPMPSTGQPPFIVQPNSGSVTSHVTGLLPNTTYQFQMYYDDYITTAANFLTFKTLP